MSTTLHLKCDGCDAEAHTPRIKKEFVSVSGRGYGFGSWQMPNVDEVTAAMGWQWSDPYTSCTYCPTCWEDIQSGKAA